MLNFVIVFLCSTLLSSCYAQLCYHHCDLDNHDFKCDYWQDGLRHFACGCFRVPFKPKVFQGSFNPKVFSFSSSQLRILFQNCPIFRFRCPSVRPLSQLWHEHLCLYIYRFWALVPVHIMFSWPDQTRPFLAVSHCFSPFLTVSSSSPPSIFWECYGILEFF